MHTPSSAADRSVGCKGIRFQCAHDRDKWLDHITDPKTLKAPRHFGYQGAGAAWLMSAAISPESWSEAHTQLVFAGRYSIFKRFSDSVFISLAGKSRQCSEQSMSALKVENKPFLEPRGPRSRFYTRRSVHCESLFPPQHAGPGGGRNTSKHGPDGPGKRGFGKRMFVQNLPKIENQGEEECTLHPFKKLFPRKDFLSNGQCHKRKSQWL